MNFFHVAGPLGRTYILKFLVGEPLVKGLVQFAAHADIGGSTLEAIGAVRDAEIGWFDTEALTYRTRTFPETLELVSLMGTLARDEENQPVVHAHVCLAGRDLEPWAGHLVEAECAVTVEVILREIGMDLRRRKDETFGLKLLHFPETEEA